MGLVEGHGGAIALGEIASVQHVDAVRGRAEHYRIHHRPGAAPVELMPFAFADLQARPVQLIPSEPGTMLLSVYLPSTPEEKPFFDRVPILAWALCIDGQVRPLLFSGVCRGYNPESKLDHHPDYVELPDGAIYQFGYDADRERFDDMDAVIRTEVARAARYAAEARQ